MSQSVVDKVEKTEQENVVTVPSTEELENTEAVSEFKPYRVFINDVDSFHSKYIAAYITDQIYGASKILGGPGEGEEVPVEKPLNTPMNKYEFIGSLTGYWKEKSEDILYTIDDSAEEFKEEILKCGFIIYDITKRPEEIAKALKTLALLTQQLDEIAKIGPKTYEQYNETKIFILVSTVMTWALTKPLDPDDPDLPFSEVDYRKRRPHPNYKDHYACEKEVIKTGQKHKDKLKTYVVCSGITYGEEEDDLEFFFKMAWYNETIPIFDPGTNKIPLIHVRDLAKALHRLMENAPIKPQYILAVEQTPCTLKQVMRSLSKALSDGKTSNIVAEEAFLYKDMTQTIFERTTVNLNMEPVFLVENLQIEWQNDMNLSENMKQIVEEFRKAHQLKPVKIILHGPPGSGKTRLAKKLCEYYKSKYISTATMLDDYLKIWKEDMEKPKEPKDTEYLGEGEMDEMAEEEEHDPQAILEQIRETQMLMEGGIDKMPDDYIIGLLKRYLEKNFCQNRGYVLDDYPYITAQAKELFGQTQDIGGEEEEAAAIGPGELAKIFPDLIVSLIATDEEVCKSVMKLSEDEIKDTPNEEERFLERLQKFRENNTDDNTILNYFDELEIDIILIDVKDDDCEEAFALVANKLGAPVTFGLTPEEQAELERLRKEEERLAAEKEALNQKLLSEQAENERKEKMEKWAETLTKLQLEEEKILVAQSEPLRHYLMKYVFPTLTKGLIELATIKPDDPVDFLAEYLFKENPEGRMFDPSFNGEGEDLYKEFKKYIENIIDENEAFSK